MESKQNMSSGTQNISDKALLKGYFLLHLNHSQDCNLHDISRIKKKESYQISTIENYYFTTNIYFIILIQRQCISQ